MASESQQREPFLPYGKQCVSQEDIEAVVSVLQSDWLTTGPQVEKFESAVASFTETEHAVAVNSGTAALHAAMFAIDLRPGDEVIVPTITFAASANAALYQRATPVFADVLPGSLLLDPDDVQCKITSRTRAIVAVDFAGQPCDYDQLREIADRHDVALVADACHSLGGEYRGKPVGTLADLTAFSFHPVKPITTGEGGMVVTGRADYAERMKRFRNHGITSDHRSRSENGTWFYEMVDLGFNYRLSDLQCALGRSQLRRLPDWLDRRCALADRYDRALFGVAGIEPLTVAPHVQHAYHLYAVRCPAEGALRRDRAFSALRFANIGVNVHYIPVHLHPYYRQHLGTGWGDCPVAEAAYEQIMSLPIFPGMTFDDVDRVVGVLHRIGIQKKAA